ncbi:MAG: DNA primase, partial [Gammaproteobacteria bacterium]|nr:DNA primase [Gammaproteobacteria bacterium]
EEESEKPRENLAPLFHLMTQAGEWYQQQLKSHPQAHSAVDYLKERGLSGEIAARYQLGFAPEGWSHLHEKIGQDEQTTAQLTRTGMLIQKDHGGHYDRFRNRIIFPIHDSRGRIIGFGGRVLGDEKPKYLNSPESPLFHKGKELYGLYQARKSSRTLTQILVVEGYMDVVALAQYGIRYCVATLGTATTSDHLYQLFRSVNRVIFCFDGDRAGRDAARKAMDTAIPLMRDGREILFMFLPDGEDPDSLVRKEGTQHFEQRVTQATPLSHYFFTQLQEQTDPHTIDGRAKLVALARPKLSRLPAGMFREMMFKQLSTLVEIEADTISSHLLEPTEQQPPFPRTAQPKPQQASRNTSPSPVRIALSTLLHHPQLIRLITETTYLKQIDTPGVTLLNEVIETLHQSPNLSTAALLERWRGREDESLLHKVARWTPDIPEEGIEKEFTGAMQKLKSLHQEQQTDQLLRQSSQRALSADEKRQLQQLLSSS